ncbi:MAG: efflux RND transporter periplasmic adaptor subunit [Rhodospirillales bacterium]|nr:efflux RND transporter periplasmic adaptor subunit [Rhodospirillales bacterium]
MLRYLVVPLSIIGGFALAAANPGLVAQVGTLVPAFGNAAAGQADEHGPSDSHGHGNGGREDEHAEEGVVHLTEQQIASAGITVAAASGGELVKALSVPGTVAADADRLAHVASKVPGTLKEIRKKLGDSLNAGEVVALVESREIADAKSEFLAAIRSEQLARTVFVREKGLWEKRISAQQDFLEAQNAAEEAKIRLDLARQKLVALGLQDGEITSLPKQSPADLRIQEVRAQIGGKVIDRSVALGEFIEANADILVVADLDNLWIEMTVSPADVPFIRQGQTVTVTSGAGQTGEANIIFISPVVNADTRSVRVVAAMANGEQRWRPGDFVTARIQTESQPVDLIIPRKAVQTVEGEAIVFVRTDEGFEKREIVLGRGDDETVEIVFGLDPGEVIAVENTFVLKAELGKSEAGHAH